MLQLRRLSSAGALFVSRYPSSRLDGSILRWRSHQTEAYRDPWTRRRPDEAVAVATLRDVRAGSAAAVDFDS